MSIVVDYLVAERILTDLVLKVEVGGPGMGLLSDRRVIDLRSLSALQVALLLIYGKDCTVSLQG